MNDNVYLPVEFESVRLWKEMNDEELIVFFSSSLISNRNGNIFELFVQASFKYRQAESIHTIFISPLDSHEH